MTTLVSPDMVHPNLCGEYGHHLLNYVNSCKSVEFCDTIAQYLSYLHHMGVLIKEV